MSKGVNKVIIVGNVGKEPEFKEFPGGSVANFSVATSESWKDKTTGDTQERTEWHRIVFYRRLAEIARDYLIKGAKVYIEGKLHTRKWQDKQGVDHYTTEIIGSTMQMLSSSKKSIDQSGSITEQYIQTAKEFHDDDIPF